MLASEWGKRQAHSPRFTKTVEYDAQTGAHENSGMDSWRPLGKRVAADAPEGTGPAISKLRSTLKQLESSLENLAEAERRKDGVEKTVRHSTASSSTASSKLSLDEIDVLIQRSLQAVPLVAAPPLPTSAEATVHTKQHLRIRELEAQAESLAIQVRDATARLQEERLNRQHQESLLQCLQQKVHGLQDLSGKNSELLRSLQEKYTKNFDLLEAAKLRSSEIQATISSLKESNQKLLSLVELQTNQIKECTSQLEQKEREKLELASLLDASKLARSEAETKVLGMEMRIAAKDKDLAEALDKNKEAFQLVANLQDLYNLVVTNTKSSNNLDPMMCEEESNKPEMVDSSTQWEIGMEQAVEEAESQLTCTAPSKPAMMDSFTQPSPTSAHDNVLPRRSKHQEANKESTHVQQTKRCILESQVEKDDAPEQDIMETSQIDKDTTMRIESKDGTDKETTSSMSSWYPAFVRDQGVPDQGARDQARETTLSSMCSSPKRVLGHDSVLALCSFATDDKLETLAHTSIHTQPDEPMQSDITMSTDKQITTRYSNEADPRKSQALYSAQTPKEARSHSVEDQDTGLGQITSVAMDSKTNKNTLSISDMETEAYTAAERVRHGASACDQERVATKATMVAELLVPLNETGVSACMDHDDADIQACSPQAVAEAAALLEISLAEVSSTCIRDLTVDTCAGGEASELSTSKENVSADAVKIERKHRSNDCHASQEPEVAGSAHILDPETLIQQASKPDEETGKSNSEASVIQRLSSMEEVDATRADGEKEILESVGSAPARDDEDEKEILGRVQVARARNAGDSCLGGTVVRAETLARKDVMDMDDAADNTKNTTLSDQDASKECMFEHTDTGIGRKISDSNNDIMDSVGIECDSKDIGEQQTDTCMAKANVSCVDHASVYQVDTDMTDEDHVNTDKFSQVTNSAKDSCESFSAASTQGNSPYNQNVGASEPKIQVTVLSIGSQDTDRALLPSLTACAEDPDIQNPTEIQSSEHDISQQPDGASHAQLEEISLETKETLGIDGQASAKHESVQVTKDVM